VEYQHQQFHFNLPLVGLFNVYNALAAIGVGLIEKIPLEAIRQSLQHMTGVPGRMEIVPIDEEYTVIVDYAHTPDSLANVLQCVRQFTSGRLFCVVGCGGNRDRKKRPLMAKIAAETADFTVFTSDNPRWEDPHVIIKEMESGLIGHELLQTKYKSIVDRKEAITWVLKQAKAGDVIVIAGKGHETYQEIKGERFNFDDRQVTKEAVQAIKSLKGD
jgi:UDP-N-acetylmuramoyl-L-alanyl-D-glutamate--2,6-diaminopimelate ligase